MKSLPSNSLHSAKFNTEKVSEKSILNLKINSKFKNEFICDNMDEIWENY